MQLFYQPEAETGTEFSLNREESKHISKVLRMKRGEYIQLTNGKGDLFDGIILDNNPRQVSIRIEHKEHIPARDFFIHIAFAPTKNPKRTEWFVEKAVELGIEEISFFYSRHSERRVIKINRLQNVAIVALKQSFKYYLPVIHPITSLDDVMARASEEQRWITHCYPEMQRSNFKELKPNSRSIVLTGPEGGFNKDEINKALEKGFKPVELSPYRLRTETAALSACYWLNIENQYPS